MKVAIVGPFQEELRGGGVEHHVHYLSAALEGAGIEVERWSWKVGENTRNIKRVGLLGLGSVFKKSDADIVHLHSTATAFTALTGLGRFSERAVATIHSFYRPEFENTARMKLVCHALGRPYVLSLRRIRNNIAVSEFVKQEAEENRVPVGRVIGNGIPLGEVVRAKRSGDLESDVVMVGRFTRQKGVFDFIEAFSGSGVRAVLVGYGDPKMEKEVMGRCKRAGVRCIVNAERGIVLSAIKSSRVLALPSQYEPFGIVGLEAMALGKPIVAYACSGGPRDYVDDGENGFLVGGDAGTLRERALSLLGDDGLLKKLSLKAKSMAKAFDWPLIAGKVKTFYSGVLG